MTFATLHDHPIIHCIHPTPSRGKRPGGCLEGRNRPISLDGEYECGIGLGIAYGLERSFTIKIYLPDETSRDDELAMGILRRLAHRYRWKGA